MQILIRSIEMGYIHSEEDSGIGLEQEISSYTVIKKSMLNVKYRVLSDVL